MTLKKIAIAVLLTFILAIAFNVIALTSPEGFQYPNPGHYPGEIGPGTFNSSNNPNPYWSFPAKVGINKSGQPNYALDITGIVRATSNAIIGGNLDVSGNANVGNDLDVSGSVESGGSMKIGDSGELGPGTVRWNGSEFEGYNGSEWSSLTEEGGTGGRWYIAGCWDTSACDYGASCSITVSCPSGMKGVLGGCAKTQRLDGDPAAEPDCWEKINWPGRLNVHKSIILDLSSYGDSWDGSFSSKEGGYFDSYTCSGYYDAWESAYDTCCVRVLAGIYCIPD